MAEDTGEGQQSFSRRDFLKKLGMGAAVVGGAAAVGKAGYESLQELGVISTETSSIDVPLEDLLLKAGEGPEKWDPHSGKIISTKGFLMRISPPDNTQPEGMHTYALFPDKPAEAINLQMPEEELRNGAKEGRFLPVKFYDGTNPLIEALKPPVYGPRNDQAKTLPPDEFMEVKGTFMVELPESGPQASLTALSDIDRAKPIDSPGK